MTHARLFSLVLILVMAACASAPKPKKDEIPKGTAVSVSTTEGAIVGSQASDLSVFLGIPYGAPVGGLNRWLPPKPPQKRTSVFDARQFGPACEQTVATIPKWMLSEAGETVLYELSDLDSFAAEEKSEDCLRLNIWTPALPQAANEEDNKTVLDEGLPVIVHLHGGGLTSGSARHLAQDGALLAKEGVVVITINYRLGSIGFLAGDGQFKGDVMKGSRGFMDTVRALEWVRDNIANFGGDPNNVTLMGQSGGGTNVWSVLASPSSKGLVRRAIIMSGPIYDYPLAEHKKLTQSVLEDWDVSLGDEEALAKVKTKDAISTKSTTTLVGSKDKYGSMSKTYLPSAGATGTAFLPDDILTAIQKGRLDDIDILVGGCDDDAKVSIIMVPLPNFLAINIWNGYIGGLIADSDEGFDEMTDGYIAAMPTVSKTRAKEQLQTDALYRIRSLKAATIHSQRTEDKAMGQTYVYQFNWKSPTFPDDIGAMHGLDLVFAFGNLKKFPKTLGIVNNKASANAQRLSKQMLQAWASFAKTGKPSSQTLPEWPEYEGTHRHTMIFDRESKVVKDPGGTLRKLWK